MSLECLHQDHFRIQPVSQLLAHIFVGEVKKY